MIIYNGFFWVYLKYLNRFIFSLLIWYGYWIFFINLIGFHKLWNTKKSTSLIAIVWHCFLHIFVYFFNACFILKKIIKTPSFFHVSFRRIRILTFANRSTIAYMYTTFIHNTHTHTTHMQTTFPKIFSHFYRSLN